MSYKNIHDVIRGTTKRKSFAEIEEVLDIPNLVELQKNSYNEFISEGIASALKDFSPIHNNAGDISIYLSDPYIEDVPNDTIENCKKKDLTYSKPLRVKATLEKNGEIFEGNIFMCDMPVMTDSGSFVINGNEKVIVSQLAKSPGVFCDKVNDKNGIERYNIKIQPTRGAWLEFEHDHNGVLWVKVDKNKKVTSTVLLKALDPSDEGTNEKVLNIFNDHETIKKTLEKDPASAKDTLSSCKELYVKIKPNDNTPESAMKATLRDMFFYVKRYDLGKPGRYKMNKKLALAERIYGPNIFIAKDIKAENIFTGEIEILAKKGDSLSREEAINIQNKGVNEVFISTNKNNLEDSIKIIGNNTVNIRSYVDLTDKEIEELGIKVNVYFPVLRRLIEDSEGDRETLLQLIKKHLIEDEDLVSRTLTYDDIISSINYSLGLQDNIGYTDATDHLGNKRIRAVGELLQTQLRKALDKLVKNVNDKLNQGIENIEIKRIVNVKPIIQGIKDFFNTHQLAQTMDHINPISALTHKRKLSALGPGGLTKERAGFSVRDIDYTHYGRMCPIETPEGQNIGLITSLALYAKVNEYGFLETPYRKVNKSTGEVLNNNIEYLDAEEEDKYVIAQANEILDKDNKFVNSRVTCRYKDQIKEFNKDEVDYMDVSPKQLISVATSLIPFLEHDDTTRALMGSNMQRQAVPLLKTEQPIVATGIEYKIAKDSGITIQAKEDGKVTYVSSTKIKILNKKGIEDTYILTKFERTNACTCINQKPIVVFGQEVLKGQIIADGFATSNGELSLGKNVLVAFMEWEGYNYEDAVLISDELIENDAFTSIHINEYEVCARDTQLGPEIITNDIPQKSAQHYQYLDDDGIVMVGAYVKSEDALVGKTTPKGESEPSQEEKLVRLIVGNRSKDVKNTSLKMPHGEYGVVVGIETFDKKDILENGVLKKIKVYVAQKRKISVGDKMAGRHGNKGVVSKILLKQDMPFMEDGTPIQILLNPLGVPSRMNVGQVLEVHLGMLAHEKGWKVETPVFDGAYDADISALFKEAGLPENGKFQLYDGRTGEPFENKVTVGYMYYLKLDHLVDDKVHARSTGPYSVITKQPLGGKAQFGGQRFGEMEVWALEAYGAAHLLQEILTIKSDDIEGRNAATRAILDSKPVTDCGITEAFKVLIKELQSLGLDVKALNENGQEIKIAESVSKPHDSLERSRENKEKENNVDIIKNIRNDEDEQISNVDNIFNSITTQSAFDVDDLIEDSTDSE